MVPLTVVLFGLAGCGSSGQTTTAPSPTASAEVLTHRYRVAPEVCVVFDFAALEGVLRKPRIAGPQVGDWHQPANFLFTGGLRCTQLYGANLAAEAVSVYFNMATYKSATGARLAYDTRLFKDSTGGSLPAGVELTSSSSDEDSYVRSVLDGNMFAQIDVNILPTKRPGPKVSMPDLVRLMDELVNEAIVRLRKDFVGAPEQQT